MQGDSAVIALQRCDSSAKMMLVKLMSQIYCGYAYSWDELWVELQGKWFECFEEFYEDDKQYLRFMFIVMKNHMKNIRLKESKFATRHKRIDDGKYIGGTVSEEGYLSIYANMAVDTEQMSPYETLERKEKIENICKKLPKELYRQVFLQLCEGISIKDIAENLDFGVAYIGIIRTKKIWPVVKEVLNIPDEQYELLTDNGRLYIRD